MIKSQDRTLFKAVCFFLTGCLTSTPPASKALADDHEELSSLMEVLEESHKKDVSYLGTKIVVNYSSCEPDVKSIRIFHGPADKEKREVFSLREKKSQIILDDGQYIWHYIPSETVLIRKNSPAFLEDLTKDLKGKERLIRQNYRIYLDKQTQMMNRSSMSISFQPMGTNRPARKIWIDREYGVPLRTEIYDLNGNLALLSMFSEIQFAPALDNETFNPQFPKDIIPKNITESRYADIPEAQDEITDFKLHSPTYLPEGFTLIGISRLKVGKSERIQLLYSDGLSSLSVFEDKPTVSPSGNSLPAREVLINDKKGVLYDQGLLKILDWNLEDIHVTLVAEISEDELLKVAGSIVP